MYFSHGVGDELINHSCATFSSVASCLFSHHLQFDVEMCTIIKISIHNSEGNNVLFHNLITNVLLLSRLGTWQHLVAVFSCGACSVSLVVHEDVGPLKQKRAVCIFNALNYLFFARIRQWWNATHNI